MGSAGVVAGRATVKAALERFEAAAAAFAALSLDALSPIDLLAVADRREAMRRAQAAVDHRIVGRLAGECDPRELGAKNMAEVLAARLRISRAEARRRIADAQDLGPRTAMTGDVLDPVLPCTAAGVADGVIGVEHVAIIRSTMGHLPGFVDAPTRETTERQLAQFARGFGPEELGVLAKRTLLLLDSDGTLSEGDRARRRGITIGRQGADGLARISGWVTPEFQVTWEAILAKLAAAGRCNPDEGEPCVDGEPSQTQIDTDLRSPGQRVHDAFTACGRAVLASKTLGQHRGLPVTIIISTTLGELQAASGHGVSGGGTVLSMPEVIRQARHAFHYLAVFDDHTGVPLYLGRSRRVASPGQRIVLYAKDRGCTKPGCTAPGYWCEVHHIREWVADHGPTDVDQLTLACPGDHQLIQPGGWQTQKNQTGHTEWIPPPHLDTGGPRTNTYHHPEHLLPGQSERDDDP